MKRLYSVSIRDTINFVITTFKSSHLENYWISGDESHIQKEFRKRVKVRLTVMDAASSLDEIRAYGWDLHWLKGNRKEDWSLAVNASWRITFRFEDGNCVDVDFEQYH